MMPDTVEVNQKAAVGAQNTQIAVQNNISGLSVADAMQMALAMFREYYPQLRREALADIEQMVTERLSVLQTENIVPPTPRIVIPVLQNASITDEKDIRVLYANLLANSMDKFVKDGVHPGFVEVINQMCPDEAKIMYYFKMHEIVPIITLQYEANEGGTVNIIKDFSNVGELVNCEKPLDIKQYFDNLIRLGLLEKGTLASLTDKTRYEPLKKHPYILSHSNDQIFQNGPYKNSTFSEGYIELTDFGKAFCSICLSRTVIRSAIQ